MGRAPGALGVGRPHRRRRHEQAAALTRAKHAPRGGCGSFVFLARTLGCPKLLIDVEALMPETSRTIECADCGRILDEPVEGIASGQVPCPYCGSLRRHVRLSFSETLALHERVKLKARDPKGGRPRYEAVQGDDLSRKTGRWMKLTRIIDRARDWYQEIVTDPRTGEAVHKTEEPLSQHRFHGSAKRQVCNSTDDDA